MTKREFRRLWAVPADIDARVRRMHRLEESLLKEPLVVTDTVQASGLSAPYALGTVTVRGRRPGGAGEKACRGAPHGARTGAGQRPL